MGGGRKAVEMVSSRGCTAMLTEAASSFRKNNIDSLQRTPDSDHQLDGPFSGLVICITGLSKETKKQVKDATEKLGGVYSPSLTSHCTHLVVQSTNGLKLDASAMKHASSAKGGLSVVTIGWFVDSVRKKVRLSEELYRINQISRSIRKSTGHLGSESSYISVGSNGKVGHCRGQEEWPEKRTTGSMLAGKSMYIDPDISPLEQKKIIEAASLEGATFLKKWSAGYAVDYVVCEGTCVRRYLGRSRLGTLVTPAWILNTANAGKTQKLVHLSDDLAKQVRAMLEISSSKEDAAKDAERRSVTKHDNLERKDIAKITYRSQCGGQMQTYPTHVLQETPSNLLDSVCWNISDPTSSASTFADSCRSDLIEYEASIYESGNVVAKSENSSICSFSRPLTASEKSELILTTHILTILFPIDRYSEMGLLPQSFYSEKGFTCLQVLDYIHSFYQENLTDEEIEIAIQTDSRQAHLLHSLYSSKKVTKFDSVRFKRLEFLGSRKSFEMLKRATENTYSSVYELLIKA